MRKATFFLSVSFMLIVCMVSAQNATPTDRTSEYPFAQSSGMFQIGGNVLVMYPYLTSAKFLGASAAYSHALAGHWTLGLGLDYNFRNARSGSYYTDGSPIPVSSTINEHMWSVIPEVRYYFDRNFRGFYLGGNFIYHGFSSLTTIDGSSNGTLQTSSFGSIGTVFGCILDLTKALNLQIGTDLGVTLATDQRASGVIVGGGAKLGYKF